MEDKSRLDRLKELLAERQAAPRPSAPRSPAASQPDQSSLEPTLRIDKVHRPPALQSMPHLDQPLPELIRQMRAKMPDASGILYGFRPERDIYYMPLPAHLANQKEDAENVRPPGAWRVELHDLAPAAPPMGFDLLGDVVIGLSTPGQPAPNIDLSAFKGREKAVSRHHAMLRPSRNHLYLIDLDSTNGTRLNMARISSGAAVALGKINTITLGDLTFTLKIIEGPA